MCRLWSETLLPEDSLLGGQISENTHSFSSSLPGLAGNKDKIQHALEVHLLIQSTLAERKTNICMFVIGALCKHVSVLFLCIA